MNKTRILLLLIFFNSVFAESGSQLDFVINAPEVKLRTLEEKEKVELFLKNRDTEELKKFWRKNSKRFGKHIVIIESIAAYCSFGGYDFDVYDYDHNILYTWPSGKKKKIKIDVPDKLNNTAYCNSLGIKDSGLIIFSVLNEQEQSFCAFYGGLEYNGKDSQISEDYEKMIKFLMSMPMY